MAFEVTNIEYNLRLNEKYNGEIKIQNVRRKKLLT